MPGSERAAIDKATSELANIMLSLGDRGAFHAEYSSLPVELQQDWVSTYKQAWALQPVDSLKGYVRAWFA